MATEITWEDAVLQILKESTEPMYYGDITDVILRRGLKTTVGKTPNYTVAGVISKLRSDVSNGIDIIKTQPGVFYLRSKSSVSSNDTSAETDDELDASAETDDELDASAETDDELDASAETDDELDATDAPQNLAVAAYGLHWERDKVDWSTHRLLGYDIDPAPDQAIDFANQQGVYLLHSWQSVVYVGKTAAREGGLFQRLHNHHSRQIWSGKWERYSWFGLRRVDEAGNIVDSLKTASKEVVTALIEAVLIETLRPSFNNQQGNYMGTLYRQAIDPNIAKARAQQVLRLLPGP